MRAGEVDVFGDQHVVLGMPIRAREQQSGERGPEREVISVELLAHPMIRRGEFARREIPTVRQGTKVTDRSRRSAAASSRATAPSRFKRASQHGSQLPRDGGGCDMARLAGSLV
jgi:hypothetical protein